MRTLILAIFLLTVMIPRAGASPGTEGCYDLEAYQEDLYSPLSRRQAATLDIWFDSDDIRDIPERDLEDIATELFAWSEELLTFDWEDIPMAAWAFHIAFTDSLYIQHLYVNGYTFEGRDAFDRYGPIYEASLATVFAAHETGYGYCGDLWTDVFPQYEDELT